MSDNKQYLQKFSKALEQQFKVEEEVTVAYKPDVSSLKSLFNDTYAISIMCEEGVPFQFFSIALQSYPLSLKEWSDVLHVSVKTLERYRAKANHTFSTGHSEKILSVIELLDLAKTFFANNKKLRLWLDTPSHALGHQQPVRLLHNNYGQSLLKDELVRMEHGIFV